MAYLYEVFGHLLRLWMGIWLHTHTVTTTDASPDFGKLAEILLDAIVQTMPLCIGWGCRTFQTASHVHGNSTWVVCAPSQLADVQRLHTHTITTTDVSPDLWELGEILPNTSVQTMPLHFGWVCRTFQTTSHVRGIPTWGVWAPSQVVNGHMASYSHPYHHSCFPRFGKIGWNPTWCKCANHTATHWLSL